MTEDVSSEKAPFIDANALVGRLWRARRMLPGVLGVVSPEEALWRPDDGVWSITEIVWHMADEESEDFRLRLRLTLEDPSQPWPPIDPEGWAKSRNYQGMPVGDGILKFANQRGLSLAWLRALKGPDWSKTHMHPMLGPMRAGDILSAWAAHDALHLRQISKRIYQMARRDAGGYSTAYAGAWTAHGGNQGPETRGASAQGLAFDV